MHTIVVRMSIDPARADEACPPLARGRWSRGRAQQPGLRQRPVAAAAPNGSEGMGVVVFASPDAAASAAPGPA